MSRKDWFESLTEEEQADIQQTIEYVRNNTQRRTSALGWAQENCPKAYAAFINRPNKMQTLREFFEIPKIDFKPYFKNLEDELKD